MAMATAADTGAGAVVGSGPCNLDPGSPTRIQRVPVVATGKGGAAIHSYQTGQKAKTGKVQTWYWGQRWVRNVYCHQTDENHCNAQMLNNFEYLIQVYKLPFNIHLYRIAFLISDHFMAIKCDLLFQYNPCNFHCNFVNKIIFSTCYSDVTEASWHPNSPVTRLIDQDHVQTNIKATPTGPLWGNPPVTDGFPHKGPVTRKTIPSHNVIRTMILTIPRQRIQPDGCLCA